MEKAGKLRAFVTLWTYILLKNAEPCGAISGDVSALSICNSPGYMSYGPGDSGTIVSDINSRSMNTSCTLTLTTCSRCRIKLNFTKLFGDSDAITHNSQEQSCDYLLIFERDYPELYRYISPSNTAPGSIYISETRIISIQFCGVSQFTTNKPQFSIDFETIEKGYTFYGQYPDVGEFESIGFPRKYSSNGDTFVYHIRNDNPSGFIKLSFDDWHLSPQCRVAIQLGTKSIHVIGANPRPFVMSDGPNMTVEVYFATNVEFYSGFKARYEFVKTNLWPDKPRFVEEFYYNSVYGGQLECDCRKSAVDGQIDFLWVMPRSSLAGNKSSLMLRLMQPTLQAGDSLEIRSGNSSHGELLGWTRPADYFSNSGLYVRLRMRCSTYRSFRAIFAWFQPSVLSASHGSTCQGDYSFRCASDSGPTDICISSSLVCDGVQHCRFGDDEDNCYSRTTQKELVPANCYAYFRCTDRRRTICEVNRCNGVADCIDSSDEFECDGYIHPDSRTDDPFRSYTMLATVIPVIVGSVITFVVLTAVIGFVFQRRRHQAAVNRVRQMVRDRSASAEAAQGCRQDDLADIACRSVLTCPPSYEDTVTFNSALGGAEGTTSPPPYSVTMTRDEQSNADKDSSAETDGIPLLPPTYATVAGEPSDQHPLIACSSASNSYQEGSSSENDAISPRRVSD